MDFNEIKKLIQLTETHFHTTKEQLPVDIFNQVNVALKELTIAEQKNFENLSALTEINNYFSVFFTILNEHAARVKEKIRRLKETIEKSKNCEICYPKKD